MATIRARKQANGLTRYTAIIRLRKGKAVIHQEAKTFAHRAAAVTWARHREVQLEDPTALIQAQDGTQTLSRVIRWYIDTWRHEYNHERPKRVLGGLTPVEYARRLTEKVITIPGRL